jgi:hypothetical protein
VFVDESEHLVDADDVAERTCPAESATSTSVTKRPMTFPGTVAE